MKPAIFLDRDGVLCEERSYITQLSQMKIFPYTKRCIDMIHEMGYLAICITNQSAIGRGYVTKQKLEEINAHLIRATGLDALYYCPHHPEGKMPYNVVCDCRKPRIGMIIRATEEWEINLTHSYLIGDRASDISCGKNAGIRTILLESGYGSKRLEQPVEPDWICADLRAAVDVINSVKRV